MPMRWTLGFFLPFSGFLVPYIPWFFHENLRESETVQGAWGPGLDSAQVPTPVFHSPEVRAVIPRDSQGLECGLDIVPRKDMKTRIGGC